MVGRSKIKFWKVWKVFEMKKIFRCQNPKIEEISLPFCGEGTKMATSILGGKMPKSAKITIFRKLRHVEVSASDMWLGIYLREVLIFF